MSHTVVERKEDAPASILKRVVLGFVLTLALVLFAYSVVRYRCFSEMGLYISVAVSAVLVTLVQVIFYFRVTGSDSDRWHIITLLFTILIMLIVITGSLWIMYNLNYYMVN